MITINLTAGNEYRRNNYGILLVSETVHDIVGPRVHNPYSAHRLDVWENRPSVAHPGIVVDPRGKQTTEPYTYLLSAQATVISAHRTAQPVEGPELCLGQVVVLKVHGYSLGHFQIRALPLHDPHLVKIDHESSASVQHYIDTGDYL